MKLYKRHLVIVLVLFSIYGCASTAKMIDHASLQTKVRLSEPIFLNLTAGERTVYAKVTNTSDIQNIPLEPALRDSLAKKGITIVDNPTQATWIIQANVTSLAYNKVASLGEEAAVQVQS
jgi:hypothetical protein